MVKSQYFGKEIEGGVPCVEGWFICLKVAMQRRKANP